MMRMKITIAAAALAAGLAVAGTAQATPVAPVNVQAKAGDAVAPLSEVRHKRKWRKRHWRHRHGWRHRYHRRHYRYYYDPYYYDYGWYDPYPYRYRYYGGPGVFFHFGF
jgi:hypothetical protein